MLPIVARNGQGVAELLRAVVAVSQQQEHPPTLLRYGSDIDQALRDFVPEYGVTYPSVAYILGKRSGDAPEEHGNYLIDGKPFEQVYTIC